MIKNSAILYTIALGLFLSSCGSVKQVSDLSYSDRKQFDQAYFEASKQKLLNNTERSILLFKQALKAHPKSHAAMYQLGGLYYKKKQLPEAEEWSLKAVKTSSAYNHWYSGQLAQVYHTGGKHMEAAEVFEEMIANEPTNPEIYLQAVNQYLNAQKVGKALDALDRMEAAFGVSESSATKKEYIYLNVGQGSKAVEAIESLVEAFPEQYIYRGFLAETLLKTGNKSRAIVELEALSALDSTIGRTDQLLYQLYSEKGEHIKAYKYLKRVFASSDVGVGDKLNYFTPYFLSIKINPIAREQARELSDILLATYPSDEIAYVVKGDLYNALDSFALSRSYFAQAVTKGGADFQTWNKLLSMDAKLKRPDWQLEDSRAAIERFPTIPGFYLSQAFAHYDLEQFKLAIVSCDDGLDIAVKTEDIVELLACKAISFDELGQYSTSDGSFEEALELDPDNALIMNNYAYALAERGVKLERALELANKAIELEGKNPYNLDTKAWVLFKLKRYEEAVPLLEAAILMDPSGYESYEHLAQTQYALGDLEQARQLMEKARSLGSTFELMIP